MALPDLLVDPQCRIGALAQNIVDEGLRGRHGRGYAGRCALRCREGGWPARPMVTPQIGGLGYGRGRLNLHPPLAWILPRPSCKPCWTKLSEPCPCSQTLGVRAEETRTGHVVLRLPAATAVTNHSRRPPHLRDLRPSGACRRHVARHPSRARNPLPLSQEQPDQVLRTKSSRRDRPCESRSPRRWSRSKAALHSGSASTEVVVRVLDGHGQDVADRISHFVLRRPLTDLPRACHRGLEVESLLLLRSAAFSIKPRAEALCQPVRAVGHAIAGASLSGRDPLHGTFRLARASGCQEPRRRLGRRARRPTHPQRDFFPPSPRVRAARCLVDPSLHWLTWVPCSRSPRAAGVLPCLPRSSAPPPDGRCASH